VRNDSSGNDPRTIWQNQPTEPSIMTLEKIRQKTQERHVKTRRQMIGNLIVPLAVCAFYVYGIAKFPNPVLRTVFACGIAWSLAGQYFFNRGMWSAMLPGDAALISGIESYRREVERQRSLFGRFMLCQFGPLMFAIATLILLILTLGSGNRGMPLDGAIVKGALLKMSPFLTLTAIWIVGFFVVRMRAQRQLQREIDELNEIERANR
jgi:hypothetical protein